MSETEEESGLFGVSDVREETRNYADLFGGGGTPSVWRLEELFDETSDPRPDEVFRAWYGIEDVPTPGEAATSSSHAPETAFDPAEDDTPSTHLIQIKDVYERAIAADMEEAAALLRTASVDVQRKFVSFLRSGDFLPEREPDE